MPLVGTDVAMVGGLAKVTGAVNYAPDLVLPRMLYAKALRSPYPHAKLLRVDASKAEKYSGVVAVVTHEDLTGLNPYFGPVVDDQPVVATDRVRHVGEVVALVAAESREIAEEALDLIEVDYQELPAVFDLLEAAKPGAPVLHAQRNETNAGVHREEFNFEFGGNVCSVFRVADGDIQKGFKEAEEIFENTYLLPPVQHGHIEPHAATAYWEPSGKLVVHSASQNPSGVQEQLAHIFNLPENKVRVIVPILGGGYGGKTHARLEPALALLARRARRPVQWVLTRDEVFLTGRRYGALVKIKTGVKRDGAIVARQVEVFYEIGAYALNGPVNAKTGCYVSSGPYNIPNRSLSTYSVYTNLPPTGPFRGVGVSHVCWAYESEMDDIARRLGLDPLALRLKHLVKEGDVFVTGEKLVSVGITDCLERAAAAIGWNGREEQLSPADGNNLVRGKGLAVTIKSTTTPTTSSANVRLNADGSAILLTSSVDMGQGALTSLAQIVGDELGLPFEKVSVSLPDTDITPYDKSTSSSRTTFHMGQAAQKAAREIRNQVLEVGAKKLEARLEDLELREGAVSVRGVPDKRLSITDIFKARFGSSVGSIFGGYCFKSEGGLNPKTGKGKAAAFWFFSACGVEVEVDIETGKVRVLNIVTAVDVGKAVHPKQCGLQNEGSMLSGMGSALFEEMLYDNGQPINSNFLEYMLPSMEDHPLEFHSVLVETPHPEGPFGAKGMGEAALPSVAPAIGNAIANALGGIRIRDLPIKPDKIIAMLNAGKERS
ncbi:MAG TPA: xanthine dehydrogenase family protein molybdopterin-binding subunit [Candidatus Binatia bacterium]|nr:xanthine dehydrogenase family protein molybdopterin-binding subunit [Candidatus Binatia bacterium]